MVKKYYYKVESDKTTRMSGRIVKVAVLKFVNGKVVRIGETEWNTASYKGDQSAVLDFLIKKGLVKQSDFPSGYYTWDKAEKAGINIEQL